ncbi:MmcQ/YjbR family DNA-binding protein [Galactobacter caseinivorans]|uniref:MmcQ/YjbR family DNA-binding protein n=1 Tax=Galactobacter caseinivorans TaxID=2676123 RepID=A0A496PFC1_9MICC|nr:MmcQ/YjbR family DNA-binding protein [Galactobacter caseinivorans]RKW69402.1 MmcQ/YjbR family DNA-binding protein [Galactobacter caseinivorans]
MELEELARICLALPGAYEDEPFGPGHLVYRIRVQMQQPDKMFAMLTASKDAGGATRFNLKCDPADADRQRTQYPEIVPGYHMNKQHWNTVRIGGDAQATLTPTDLAELIEDSYDLVVATLPRRHQERLRWNGLTSGR